MKSMTGFGSAKSRTPQLQVEVNIRTVNSRFLDVRVHLPKEWSPYESEFRKQAKEFLQRGTVDIFVIRQQQKEKTQVSVRPNIETAEAWLKAAKKLQSQLKLSGEISIQDLISKAPVLEIDQEYRPAENEKDRLLEVSRRAFTSLVKERAREGKNLRRHLESLLNELDRLVHSMIQDREKANSLHEKKLQTRIQNRFKGIEVDQQRLAQEFAIQLEKLDIDEEIERLKEHIRVYRKLIKAATTEGKKLDFYIQELIREVNTIGSKSQLASLTQNVILAKTTIEKMREQVQNVE